MTLNALSRRKVFSFKAGKKPYRYCVSVSKDIYSDGFTASKAYTYKDNVLTGYDSQLTIAGGTEYSVNIMNFSQNKRRSFTHLW